MSLLAARALEAGIGDLRICRGFDLDIECGQRWALLGGNGAGKTTLLHTLAGLRRPFAGGVLAEGVALERWPRRALARHIGILFQDSHDTFPGTVLETALGGRYPHLPFWAIEGAGERSLAAAALSEVQLSGFETRRVDTLSGGERRRLAIAVLLVQAPRLWLLDEPTNHLDLRHQLGLLDLVERRVRAIDGAMVMALHDPNLALRSCTHAALLLGAGRVLCGAAAEVITAASLEQLYGCAIRAARAGDGREFYFPA